MQITVSRPGRRNDWGVVVGARVRSAAVAGLVGFHGLLLWQRCADATILDPAVLAKYAAALLLLIAVRVFQRIAPQHLRGRRAQMVFWLLVLLLHTAAPVSEAARDVEREIVAIIQIGLVVPLIIAIAGASAAGIGLRSLHLVPMRRGISASSAQRIAVPARAPPFAR